MNDKLNSKPLTLIGFDYGTKSIGTAVGQMVTRTASPLKAIHATKGIPHWQLIDQLIEEWSPDALIVGLPLHMDDSTQPITKLARTFMDQLRNRFNLPVYEIDERLTTKEARSQLFKEYGLRGLQKGAIDSTSAKIILEQWMNMVPGVNYSTIGDPNS